jgi:hypothetical protein
MRDDDREQLKDLVAEKGIKIKCTFLWPHSAWKCTLSYKGRKITVDNYRMGSGHSGEPEAYGVLGSLLMDVSDFASYAPGMPTFEQWADDIGMDSDSMRAFRMYEACKAEYPKVKKFLGAEFERFANAEH